MGLRPISQAGQKRIAAATKSKLRWRGHAVRAHLAGQHTGTFQYEFTYYINRLNGLHLIKPPYNPTVETVGYVVQRQSVIKRLTR